MTGTSAGAGRCDYLMWIALAMTVLGWSLIWACGLSLVVFIPVRLAVSVFFVGLILIPVRNALKPTGE